MNFKMTLTFSDHLGPADLAEDLLLDRVGVLFTPDDLAEVLLSDRVAGLFTPDDLAEVLLADRVVGLFTPDDLAEALLEDPAAEEDDEEEAEELLDPPPVRSDPLSPGSRTCLRPSTNCALSGLSCPPKCSSRQLTRSFTCSKRLMSRTRPLQAC